MDITRAIRHIRSEMNVPPGRRAEVLLAVPERNLRALLKNPALTSVYWLERPESISRPGKSSGTGCHAVTRGIEVFVPLKGLIDVDRETARLKKSWPRWKRTWRVRGKLGNPGFWARPRLMCGKGESQRG